MVKNNQNRSGPRNRKPNNDRPRGQSGRDQGKDRDRNKPKKNFNSNPRFKNRKFSKKTKSVDQLDKELEMYWGNEVGSKHLDKDMDDYWQGKKDESKE